MSRSSFASRGHSLGPLDRIGCCKNRWACCSTQLLKKLPSFLRVRCLSFVEIENFCSSYPLSFSSKSARRTSCFYPGPEPTPPSPARSAFPARDSPSDWRHPSPLRVDDREDDAHTSPEPSLTEQLIEVDSETSTDEPGNLMRNFFWTQAP